MNTTKPGTKPRGFGVHSCHDGETRDDKNRIFLRFDAEKIRRKDSSGLEVLADERLRPNEYLLAKLLTIVGFPEKIHNVVAQMGG